MKPDVQKQMQEKMHQSGQSNPNAQNAVLKAVITFKAPNAESRSMTVEDLIHTVQSQADKLEKMRELCNRKVRENSDLIATIKDRDEVIAAQLETIERQSGLLDAK
jgi:CRISPR/Cas system-associated exonuclease Cas4 (RecB family)